MCGIAVSRETRADELAFFIREECRCVGIVVDEPVCADANNDRGDAFLRGGLVEPGACAQALPTLTRMKIQRHPFDQTTPRI